MYVPLKAPSFQLFPPELGVHIFHFALNCLLNIMQIFSLLSPDVFMINAATDRPTRENPGVFLAQIFKNSVFSVSVFFSS